MKKMFVMMAVLLLALPVVASAAITGQCVGCHTMHGSEKGTAVDTQLNANLLRYDCLGCHAQNPSAGSKNWTIPNTTSSAPQVAHAEATTLAGGKFNAGDNNTNHTVIDVVAAGIVTGPALGDTANNEPPGISHSASRHVFTDEGSTTAFDMFTCAGARGCHGTRSQALVAATVDNGTANNWEIDARRTGIAAVTGAHHNNLGGARDDAGYGSSVASHSGATIGKGYRFIPGLKGFENVSREYVNSTDHNEYYGAAHGFYDAAAGDTGCDSCHVQDVAQSNTRAGFQSHIRVPNNSMSGFCSTCHGNFHSAGGVGTDTDRASNGVSGAFLRHPSDYVIPNASEYAAYTVYNATAPVARPSVASSASASVAPGTDMVMCLSCHVAHGSSYNYLLRFDYSTMTAGTDTALGAVAKGGCLACHTQKGVAP